MCSVVIQQAENMTVPAWVTDLTSFHRWTESEEFPEEGRIDYLAGEIWIDMSEEKVWSHNQVKTEYTIVLGTLAKTDRNGRFFQDGVRVQHPEADLSVAPDGVFVCNDSIQTMRVTFAPAADGEDLRINGSPNMALEVLSDSTVRKDTVRLRELYWEAGIREYWLVDARKGVLRFDILRHTAKGYVAVRPQRGWLKSAVFDRSFRLTQGSDDLGRPTFTLEVR
jgi:Uma2 family endonuclease